MARILATLISGASYGLLFPPLGLGALAWVALVPLVLALRGMPAWRAGLLAVLWGWVGTGGVITWMVPTQLASCPRN